MKDLDAFRKAGEDLYHKLHLATYPVAITYIKDEKEIPEGVYRPSKAGIKLSLCQAITMSRRLATPVAMTADDNFCTPSTAFHGWADISKEDLIESQVKQGWHRDRQAEAKRIEGSWALLRSNKEKPLTSYHGFVCAPLKDAKMPPDSVILYGDGAQVMHVIHALCYDYKHIVTSFFEGFGESCVKGGLIPFLLERPQVVIPGMGDRKFAGIGDNELAVGMPAHNVSMVLENLFKTGGDLNIGYPVQTLFPMNITEDVTPGFKYLREKMDKKQVQ